MGYKVLLALTLLVAPWTRAWAQEASFAAAAAWGRAETAEIEAGAPFYTEHFAPKEYRSHPQNWDVVQDARDLIYVANTSGILQFDGARWRTIKTTNNNNTIVRSLATDADGTVYAGVQGDFGYLAPDSTHTLRYVSLLDEVKPGHRGFKDVWGTHATPAGVYFQTRKALFRWDGSGVTMWPSQRGFHTSFAVRGELYVRDLDRGLLRMEGDSLRLAPGGDRFSDAAVFVMAPYGSHEILVGTRDGFLLYDGKEFRPFRTEVDSLLEVYPLLHGAALPDGGFAFSLLGSGVYVVDDTGRLLQVFDKTAELPGSGVNYVYPDKQGGLWLAMHNEGVVRVDARSPLSLFDERLGLEGVVYYIQRYEGALYVATGAGLYRLDREPLMTHNEEERSAFEAVPGVHGTVWSLLPTPHGLLVATDFGVYRVREGQGELISRTKAFWLEASGQRDGSVAYVGTKDGLCVLEHTAEAGWKLHPVAGIEDEIRTVVKAEGGTLWLGTISGEVLRARLLADDGSAVRTEHFAPQDGLPEGKVVPAIFGGKAIFGAPEGIFRPRRVGSALRFYQDTLLTPRTAARGRLLSFAEGAGGRFWLAYADSVVVASPKPGGGYRRRAPAALRFPKGDVAQVYVEPDGVAWVSSDDDLIRYDPSFQKDYETAFPTLIRGITDVATGDLLYGGARRYGKEAVSAEAAEVPVTVNYAQNSVRVAYAAPTYNAIKENQYQYRMRGVDKEWSGWVKAAEVTYPHLREGTYRFEVRARNGQGVTAPTATLAFRVLPPWHRTWWAYALYAAAVVFGTLTFLRYRRLITENRRARAQANVLARERQANKRLRRANDALQQANALKENFLSNTSHELRTPLTAILGFTSVLREELSERHQEFLGIIEENGERLMGTLNALLDIAKIRAGLDEVPTEKVDVCAKVRSTVRFFRPLAEREGVALKMEHPEKPVYAALNHSHFDRVIQNLVGNAIKFTDEGGEVRVVVRRDDHEARIEVRDTGVGISEAFMPHLFEEFKQESAGLSRSHEGSGLGLAIAARLTQAMRGHIQAESTKGEGSTFTLTFPLYSGEKDERPAKGKQPKEEPQPGEQHTPA